jgi:HAMP domain-containing protein
MPSEDSTGSGQRPYRRKVTNSLVLPKTQLKIVFMISVFMAAMAGCFCALAVLLVNSLFASVASVPAPSWHTYLLPLLFGSVAFVIFGAIFGLIFSHQIAGPVYHLIKIMKAVKEGDLQARVQFRPQDEFSELGAEFNSMMDKISPRR